MAAPSTSSGQVPSTGSEQAQICNTAQLTESVRMTSAEFWGRITRNGKVTVVHNPGYADGKVQIEALEAFAEEAGAEVSELDE